MGTEFGKRVRTARKNAGLSQAALARAVGVSQGTVSEMETLAHSSTVTAQVAVACGVNANWLATGEGEMLEVGASVQQDVSSWRDISNVLLVGCNTQVPRLEWHEIQGYTKGMFKPPDDRYTVVSSPAASEKCFLVQVDGDAMTSLSQSESIPQGALLLCDPNRPAEHGAIVVAKHPKSGAMIVRGLIQEGGVWWLRAHNAAYPMIEIDNPADFVVARAIEVITRRAL